jgi:putative phosphotransacetylase
MTDARAIGITAPVRESGKLAGTPGIKLVGPAGEVELDYGAIVALRHIHLSPAQALEAGVKDKDIVSIQFGGERGVVFNNVLVRSGEGHESEIHLDTDEGNAAGLNNGALGEILK